MSLNRWARRVDATHAEIVGVLRAHGCSVQAISAPGVPDLLVGFQGECHLIEVKTTKGKLKPSQKAWAASWRGSAPWIVRSPSDAHEWVQARRAEALGVDPEAQTTYCTRCERLVPWQDFPAHTQQHARPTLVDLKGTMP